MLLALPTTVFSILLQLSVALQTPFTSLGKPKDALISPRTDSYIKGLLTKWNSTGLSVAVVRKDAKTPTGWRHEFGSYGIARGDGTPITPDTVFAVASNSKLFLALSVGLLISNETLAKERGKKIKWTTKARELIPEWGLMDEDMHRGTSLQDMLSHRTGLPRHDYSGVARDGGIAEMISTLRYLRPSAEFRETFQYNNLMYETLSYLPQLLLNQTYESYVQEHLFDPLNMTSSTFSVKEAEERGTMADGFQWSMRDLTQGINGTLVPTIPYFQRPGEEKIWAGAGGVLTSARDLAVWVSMLLNNGRHPYTNETIVPEEVIEHVATGLTVSEGKASDPEFSPKVYGAGQWRFAYQGHEIIEHGGNNPGYKTQVARFPNDNLAIISLSNEANGGFLMEAVKYRIADEILGLKEVVWNDRFEKLYNKLVNETQQITPRPDPPLKPSAPLPDLAKKTFSHPTYGALQPCLVHSSIETTGPSVHTHDHCSSVLNSHSVQRILGATNLSIPTFIIPWKRAFATHLRLRHFSGNLFNVTVIWTNAEVRAKEGLSLSGKDKGDSIIGLDEHFEVEWVHGEDEGLAFKGGFWGKEGPDSREPGGEGKESAEAWFALQR
ncbi:beta-lactamase/transpeptidase-like protein [Crucibulum laeve]|uniref:Beta-lactamase/transpeptidase-like protein n=1 Tax=Crucibulum laeve TaxID=68775 RepID=A0A5C3LIC2_9AGAR|nr:beta-lactamase/transpeptidase-like protein [Crucibulum laeve]